MLLGPEAETFIVRMLMDYCERLVETCVLLNALSNCIMVETCEPPIPTPSPQINTSECQREREMVFISYGSHWLD